MLYKNNQGLYFSAVAVSLFSVLALWSSLDRRFLEKYYYKWSVRDWELLEFPLLAATCILAYLMAKGVFQGVSKIDTIPSVAFDRLSGSLLIGNIVIVCLSVALILFNREYLGLNVKELGHIALAQEFMILVGLASLMAATWKMRNSDLKVFYGVKAAWICGLMGLAVFLLLMEEISWGQHFFGWASTDAFKHNIQNETNIHNFYTNRFEFLYYSLAFACFVLLPIVAPQIRLKSFEPLRHFVPPVSFGLAAIPVAGLMYENWGILIFQVYFIVGVSLAFIAANASNGITRLSLIALALAMVGSQVVFLIYGHKLMSSYEIGEMRETSISFTLAVYSVWLLAKANTMYQTSKQGRKSNKEEVDGTPNSGSASWARLIGWG